MSIVTCIIGTAFLPTLAFSSDSEPLDEIIEDTELNIYTDVKGAKLLIDKEYIGNSPLELFRIPVGIHTLTIEYKSFLPVNYDIEVTSSCSDFYFQVEPMLLRPKNSFGLMDGVLIAALTAAAVVGGYFWVYK